MHPRKSLIPLVIFLAFCCFGCDLPPEKPKPTPAPTATPAPTPGCAATGTARECWDQRPGEAWAWICADGLTRVSSPSECQATPAACAAVAATGQVHEGGPYSFSDDIRAAIQAAYRKAGGTADLISGPERPGEWRAFVVLVADELVSRGYCVTYDYKHGEAEGRASEMGARKGGRVEYFQLETSAGRVRTPPGAMRSWAEPACCEGQAIQRTAPTPKPTPTPKPGALPPPPLSKIIVKSVGVGRPVLDASPKTCPEPEQRKWCAEHSTGGACCPGGGEDDPGRQAVEALWGPYTWTIDGQDCIASGACFLDGGNALRIVAPGSRGKRVRVTGGNGTWGEVVP